MDIKDNQRIAAERKRYLHHPHLLRKIQLRSKPYLHYILNEIERRKLPGELALLPIVESEYQTDVHSSSKAAGLWQFIPATGRRYGLKQNWWYDGRKDITASTRAAFNYLTLLNNKFKKDWALTLAAYNAGDHTIKIAQRNNLRTGKPTDYWSLKLSAETRRYVPKLYALAQIFADPQKYGVRLVSIEDKPQVVLIKTNSQIDLGLAAELSETDIETIKRLNPGYKQWATDPKGPYQLLLPYDKAEQLLDKLVSLPTDRRICLKRHRIKKGETLLTIAKSYGTNVDSIRKANRLSGNTIRMGESILVPAAYDRKERKTIATATDSMPQSTQKPAADPDEGTPKVPTAAMPKQKESSLEKLAKRFKIFPAKEEM